MQRLPTLDVDPAAVEWALQAAAISERLATYIETSRHPAKFVEAFLRGLAGEPFRVADEQAAAEKPLMKEVRTIHEEGIRLRAKLTAKYRVEFPPSEF